MYDIDKSLAVWAKAFTTTTDACNGQMGKITDISIYTM
jgi:hypothetical protein